MSSGSERRACPTCLQEFPAALARCPIHGIPLVPRSGSGRSVAPPAAQKLVIGDHYLVSVLLGQGGMARVYAATDQRTGERVAIKLLSRTYANDPRERARFVREARAMERIHHPAVVRPRAIGEHEDGRPFLVMELLTGETLADRLKRVGRLPASSVTRIGCAIASGLGAAHDIGVVHRDVKPANVFLVEGADVDARLLDFGLAKTFAATSLTETDATVGKAAYMPPEQMLADGVDARTDVYALGTVLYRAATGAMPFEAREKPDALARQLVSTPDPARTKCPDVSAALEAVLACAMRKNPAHRFAEMRAMEAALLAAEKTPDVAPEVPVAEGPDVYVPRQEMALRVARSLWAMTGKVAPF